MKKIYYSVLIALSFICANAQTINFSDVNFKIYLLSATTSNNIAIDINGNSLVIDVNLNNEIEETEALAIYNLKIEQSSITDLTGISYFSNLRTFELIYNNLIPTVDASGLIALETFVCVSNSSITSINLQGLNNLESIVISNNASLSQINTLGLSGLKNFEVRDNSLFIQSTFNHLTNLEYIHCNTLTSLSIDGLTNLKELWGTVDDFTFSPNAFITVSLTNLPNLERVEISNCGLSSITLTNLPKLYVLSISNNQLTEIDLSNLNLTGYLGPNNYGSFFYAYNNNFTHLDFSTNTFISKNISNNQLISLNIKDGVTDINGLDADIVFSGNPNLQFICVDDAPEFYDEVVGVQNLVSQYGYSNCVLNSYCTFVPGGEYFTVDGNVRFDSDNNGCDGVDLLYPNLNISITNGTQNGSYIANESGNYSIPLLAGAYTLTPTLENPSYFTLSPANIIVDFPAQTSPVIQNFCIAPNGVHNDLEVSVLPMGPARPGFDADYKIVFKNKGNTTLSGSVNLQFEDDIMDLVSSVPTVSSQSNGLLTFDFSDLLPFEEREIKFKMNINSPMETPAVNNGELLLYSATIVSAVIEETPDDNTNDLYQFVVNSFDPNDKTCIEGTVVGPDMIGQYVHYLIRFENTGTFPAENIVVKDMIDLTKFDLSTLIPTSSSHSFVTRIAADGKVEFIFENIQLPFDDANNDGYVAFKIKTLPSLAVGDTFSNTANIYFDYNFPIETNTATTAIQVLGNSDFNLTDYVTLYPNPVKNELNIKVNNTISITSINIYNSLGQLVLVATNPSESIDVSELKTGSYLMKLITDKGISNSQFIKK